MVVKYRAEHPKFDPSWMEGKIILIHPQKLQEIVDKKGLCPLDLQRKSKKKRKCICDEFLASGKCEYGLFVVLDAKDSESIKKYLKQGYVTPKTYFWIETMRGGRKQYYFKQEIIRDVILNNGICPCTNVSRCLCGNFLILGECQCTLFVSKKEEGEEEIIV